MSAPNDRTFLRMRLTKADCAILAAIARGPARQSFRDLARQAGVTIYWAKKRIRALDRQGIIRRQLHPGGPTHYSIALPT